MVTDYDSDRVAEQYKLAKQQPWRSRIETYSMFRLLGDPSRQKVIDIACGEGYFTRQLRRKGAAKVLGIDISERMIELARAQEAADPLGIEYQVADARTSEPQQDFDLAVSAWLLVYARDRAELTRMCRGVACRLRPGGRFVTVITNPDLYSFSPCPDYRKYGFRITLADQVYEGAPILWTIELSDSELEIENYYLPIVAYQSAYAEAGFDDFTVHPLELEPAPRTGRDDSGYWADFLDRPAATLLTGVKT
ncbi:class I SAM-dependent methyltransferase [Nocardia stercoris]|uniref:Class I SAM-dependent methyltransferase n=1 Tax=Nocardia stercoris TaxID=2483361 RepID=A0A3M2L5T6_9NOCA|nr:class I SAM-dependent methyltransferase [Nocardia stercoris]RMI31245.1 class I SAM-dependent methyltransferase [Nocardia stercoris]